jgi:hypothetical protein
MVVSALAAGFGCAGRAIDACNLSYAGSHPRIDAASIPHVPCTRSGWTLPSTMTLASPLPALADDNREPAQPRFVLERQLLGARFRFVSTNEAVLALVHAAYDDLPAHHLPPGGVSFQVELRVVERAAGPVRRDAPRARVQSSGGIVAAVIDADNYVAMAARAASALVVVSSDMLEHAYALRYELVEFAVFTLATRGVGLVPLHGACVGEAGRGVLLLGASGAGKSTLALHALLGGLDFVAEDAVFVQPTTMLATGVANYLHVQADALRFVSAASTRRWIAHAPVITRRSGVRKFEPDLRRGPGRLASTPLEIVGAVFVGTAHARHPRDMLQPVSRLETAARLAIDQPYAATQPGWPRFLQRLLTLGVHELRRGDHPTASVDALRALLGA